MLGWIARFVFGWSWCRHKWAVEQKGAITGGGVRLGTYYILQCEHCGHMKRRNFD